MSPRSSSSSLPRLFGFSGSGASPRRGTLILGRFLGLSLVGYLLLLWPWSKALPVYNQALAPLTRAVMLPFDREVDVYADGATVKVVRPIDKIRNPQGERYPYGLSLDTMRVTAEAPFLTLLFLLTPGLPWRRRLGLLGAGFGLLMLTHVGACWLNAMAASYQNGNLTVNLQTAQIEPLGPNPWHEAITHLQYVGPVLALAIWVTLVSWFAEPRRKPAPAPTPSAPSKVKKKRKKT